MWVSYEGRQVIVVQLKVGEEIYLVRDPHNPYDQNAIKVLTRNGRQVGFLNRNIAAVLAARLDHYGQPVKAIVSELTGGYYVGSILGASVKFDIPE